VEVVVKEEVAVVGEEAAEEAGEGGGFQGPIKDLK
jgi:hypothetical protein